MSRFVHAVILARAHKRGLHGRKEIDHQRLVALLLIGSALFRVFVWALLLVLYGVGQSGVVSLFGSVSFVTVLSVLALLLTDWGQMAASLAQLTAGDAHHDAEHTREVVDLDTDRIIADIAKLAQLPPGPDAIQLATNIQKRIAA